MSSRNFLNHRSNQEHHPPWLSEGLEHDNHSWFPRQSGLESAIVMCTNCESAKQKKFQAEIAIHLLPGLRNIDKSAVFVFPEIVVCLACGTAKFTVPEAELRLLAKGDGAPRIN